MNSQQWIVRVVAVIVIMGSIYMLTQHRFFESTPSPTEDSPEATTHPVPTAPTYSQVQSSPPDGPKAHLQELTSRIATAANLAAARQEVARSLKSGIDSHRITLTDLQSAILDSKLPVEARIIFAEAIIGFLAEEAEQLDVSALSQALEAVESPLLAARMIDLLGLTQEPEALPAIREKCTMEAENVRLSGVQAAKGIPTTAAAEFLVDCTADPDFYRVRIQAMHGVAKHTFASNPVSTILDAVWNERERTEADTPSGQSPNLNRQLIAVAATKALATIDDPQAVSFLVDEMLNTENVDTVRMSAADALAQHKGEPVASALLQAIEEPNEAVRLHAARSLSKVFGNKYASQLAAARDASSDPYVVKQISEILESD
ncbi:hypothetical protein DSCO28_53950 [Desulfosarcina ovata subsp. sediminis]|uniref:PBS lyase n=1 Tax=Desulfosarcina ovata subsp. sediminis TaxID=885957 RepID=A0A5K7ZX45_9BACT|nr:HEAT repeat domain-containing protein [Desulfosarcina ovata]BBO84829.1 hypothetical protein DSCO28_53950 [Desulfosarcina ovata subsp. sediminis]